MTNRITRVSLVANIGGYVSDVRKGKEETGALRREAERFSKGRYEASIKADTKSARTELSALEKRLQAFGKTPVDQRVNLDTDEARDRLHGLQARMSEFATTVSDARVDLDDADAQAKISRIEAALLRLGQRTADPEVDLGGVAAAESDLSTLTRQLQSFDGSDYRAQVHVDGTLAASRQASMLVDTLAMLGPTIVPLAATATPVLAGLTSGLGVAAAGAGVTALAFSGVGDALDAMGDADLAAGENARSSAAAQVAASQRIADARRGVAQARHDAVEAAQDSSRQIADAQREVEDAERSAARAAREGARQITDAQRDVADARRRATEVARDSAQAVEDAEERLADSHRRVEEAQRDLNDARQQAIRDLAELREATTDNALDVESAEIGLLEARERLTEVTADAESSELDIRKARLQVAQAEDRLSDAKQQATEDQTALTRAERDGVRGADEVVKARERVAEAQRGVQDAQEAVADAQREAVRAQRAAAREVSDAIRGVADARREAAQRNADAARSVADAERGLAQAQQDAAQSRAAAARRIEDAQRTLQRAMAASTTAMSEQSTEAADLEEKMRALGPAGQEFVRFLYELRPEMQRLQDIAQAGLFPGMQDGIESLLTLMPRAESLVGNVATALGVLAREGGAALTDPFWRDFFEYIDSEAAGILLDFGHGIGNIVRGFAGMSMALDPLSDDFRDFFTESTEDFAHWGTTLADNPGFKDFVAYVRRVAPEVWETLGEVAETMLAIAEAAAPVGELTLPVIRGLANVLEVIADSPAGPALIGAAAGIAAINRSIRIAQAVKYSTIATSIRNMGDSAQGSKGKLSRFGNFLGGPWGLAIGLGVTALAGWITSQEDAEQRVLDHAAALDEQTGALTRTNAQIVINTAMENGLYETAGKVGIGVGLLTRALLGEKDALQEVNRRHEDHRRRLEESAAETGIFDEELALLGDEWFELTKTIDGNNGEIAESRRRFETQKTALDAAEGAIGRMNRTTDAASLKQRALAGDTDLTRGELLQLAEQMGLNRQETQQLIEKYDEIPKNVDTDARFRDSDARTATKEFKQFVNRELDEIRDEDVRIQLSTDARRIMKSLGSIFGGAGGAGGAGRVVPTGGAGGALHVPRRSVGGGVGGPGLSARVAASGLDKALQLTATDVNSLAGQMSEALSRKVNASMEKAGATGPRGAPGRVLPRGSYSIGMPYLGYPGHYGADYPAATGTPVYSPWPGRVTTSADLYGSNPYNSTPYRSYGRYIRIDHSNGLSTLYAHLSQRGVGAGSQVRAGEMIGQVGTTGNSTGPHLHFETARNGAEFNPASLGLFDRGGIMRHGSGGINLSGKNELVLTNSVAKALFPRFDRSGGKADLTPDYSTWARVAATAAPRPTPQASPATGVTVQFGDVTLRDAVDVDMLGNRLGFALNAGSLGG